MDVKAVLCAYAKSKTVWGGLLQWLLSAVLTVMASDKLHHLTMAIDDKSPIIVPLNLPTLFAAASAFLGLVLYGRVKANGPLLDGFMKMLPQPPAAADVSQAISAHSKEIEGLLQKLQEKEQALAVLRKSQSAAGEKAPEGVPNA